LRNILLILFIFLTFMCGAGAYFVDKKQENIKAHTASMGMNVSAPKFSKIPDEIDRDSEVYISVDIKNTSTVPVYILDSLDFTVNGKEMVVSTGAGGERAESGSIGARGGNVASGSAGVGGEGSTLSADGSLARADMEAGRGSAGGNVKNQGAESTASGISSVGRDVVIERVYDSEAASSPDGDRSKKDRIDQDETVKMVYKITFPGIDNLPEGDLCIRGNIRYSASTSADGTYGFMYGPENVNINLADGQLIIPVRSKDIMLDAIIEEGSHDYGSVKWYRSDSQDIGIGTSMNWKPVSVDSPVTIFNLKPVFYRYEIYAKGGIVRSPVFCITLDHGEIKMQSYDYFDGNSVDAAFEKI